MAIGQYSPIADMTPIKNVVHLLRDTPYVPSLSTLRRWVKDNRLQTERQGRDVCVAYTDILDIHAAYIRSHPELLN